jgi:hypothetical protein
MNRDSSPGKQELTLSNPFEGGDFHYIDLGKPGLAPGDMFTITGLPGHDESTGRRVGSMEASETILSTWHDVTVIQDAAYRLRGGTVTVAGALRHTDHPTRPPVRTNPSRRRLRSSPRSLLPGTPSTPTTCMPTS